MQEKRLILMGKFCGSCKLCSGMWKNLWQLKYSKKYALICDCFQHLFNHEIKNRKIPMEHRDGNNNNKNTNFAYEFKWPPLFIFQCEIHSSSLCVGFYSLTAFALLRREKSIAKLLRYLACESALKISTIALFSLPHKIYVQSRTQIHNRHWTLDMGHQSLLNGICLWLFSSQELCSIQIRPWISTVETAHTLWKCATNEWVRNYVQEIFMHETHS